MTHAQLVEAGALWLRARCSVVITELSTSGETPDVIGWQSARSTLIECKVSMEDFRRDRAKYFRREWEYGIGSERYFLTPPGLLKVELLPQGWGLLELGAKVRRIHRSEPPTGKPHNARHEVNILISTLRRIGTLPPSGVSIKCYTYQTKNRATLAVATDSLRGGIGVQGAAEIARDLQGGCE